MLKIVFLAEVLACLLQSDI